MGQARIWTAMSFALVIAAACADAPTAPPRAGVGDAGASKYMLEPVIVVGTPECDPYYNPAACEDGGGKDGGTCMSSADTGGPEMVAISGCTGGGGGTPGDGSTDPSCNPRTDPDCEQPLTSADSSAITSALAGHLRPASEIPDTTARRQCADMLRQFNTSNSTGNVFRGGSNTGHYGAMDNDRIHFDPRYLDAAAAGDATAQREIANTALHEAAHILGFDHPAGPTWQDSQDYYTDVPFNLLSPGPNSCIRY